MLVLSRKPSQSIRIGSVVVTLLSVRGDKVQIGIEAPPDVRVMRQELLEAVALQASSHELQPA